MTLLDWIILAILVIAGILGLIFGAKKKSPENWDG